MNFLYWDEHTIEERKEWLNKELKSCELRIERPRKTKDNRRKIDDLCNIFKTKYYRILLNIAETNPDYILSLDRYDVKYTLLTQWSKIRQRACAIASNGFKSNISELSEEELSEVRRLITYFTDKYMEDLSNKA